jgi:hypothetical protein
MTRWTHRPSTSPSLGGRPWGLLDDPELVAAAAAPPDEARRPRPAALASFLALSTTRRRASSTTRSGRGQGHRPGPAARRARRGEGRGAAVLAAGLVLDRVVVRAQRVRVVPGLPPRLRAGPVGLRAYVSQDNVDRWTRAARLPIRLELTADGVQITTGCGDPA